MGQLRILVLGGQVVVSLMILVVAVACEGQQTDPNLSSSVTEPLSTEAPESDSPEVSPGPPPPPEGAFLAQLPPEPASQLTNLGVDVVVPGAVPPAFSVVEIRTDQAVPNSASPSNGTSYIVVYQDPTNRCFAVEFASEDISDPPATDHRLPIQSPLFGDQGYRLNYGPLQDEEMRSQFPGSNLYSDWLIGPSGAYRLVGAAYISSLFQNLVDCQDIAPEAAVAIVESFTVLTPENIGDGAGLGGE